MTRHLSGWKYEENAKLVGRMLLKRALTDKEIAARAAITPKDKEPREVTTTPTSKAEKRERDSSNVSPFKSPDAKKQLTVSGTKMVRRTWSGSGPKCQTLPEAQRTQGIDSILLSL